MRYTKVAKARLPLAWLVAAALVVVPVFGQAAYAAQSSSSHYSVDEVQVGGNGSVLGACNPGDTMCADESLGDTTVGSACKEGGSYCAQFGSLTPDTPSLQIAVTGGIQNVGVLSTDTTKTASFGIGALSYLTDGYTLYVTGATPSNGSYHLKAMTPGVGLCPCTSQPGAEQFGINLVKNTTPNVGADPVQVPEGFGFGAVSGDTAHLSGEPYVNDYTQAQEFLYKDGDAIAGSPTSSGETDYTISMILNVSGVTPAGHYQGTYSVVVVPAF